MARCIWSPGPSSNAIVQVGDQGVLVVDTMRDEDADALLMEIRKLAGDRPIRYVVNTHAHPITSAATRRSRRRARSWSAATSAAGRQGDDAFIVAHENVLTADERADRREADARRSAAWPTDTFFQNEKDLYFNGEGIELIYEPDAHTDGDVLVFFRELGCHRDGRRVRHDTATRDRSRRAAATSTASSKPSIA